MTSPVRVRYQTIEIGNRDIHLCTLRDKQQFADPKGLAESLGISSATWPIFGVVWPSSMVLANHMLNFDHKNKRILEVGCGMALSSLLLNHLKVDISATDYHPEVEGFLLKNTELNDDEPINFQRVDWAKNESLLGKFDVIIGSDLLYEDEHIQLLADFIQSHANETCEIIIVDPGRGRKNKLTKVMTEFGFESSQQKPVNTDYLEQKFSGQILIFKRES